MRELTERRAQKQEAFAVAADLVANLERLASQATCRSDAAEQVRIAEEDLLRIQRIGTEVARAEREVAELAAKISTAELAVSDPAANKWRRRPPSKLRKNPPEQKDRTQA